MLSAIVIGLGLITAVVGSFACEIYLAKKFSTASARLDDKNY
jgi:hypothetical protein